MKTISAFALLLFLNVSCIERKKAAGNAEAEMVAQGYVKAEIKKYEVDGCGFMLFLENGKKLNPDNLADEYKIEGLKVWVQFSVKKNTMSICMAGDNVTINKITIRK